MTEKDQGIGDEVNEWLQSGADLSPEFNEWLDQVTSDLKVRRRLYDALRSWSESPEYEVRESLLGELSSQKFSRGYQDLTESEQKMVNTDAYEQNPSIFDIVHTRWSQILGDFGFEGDFRRMSE